MAQLLVVIASQPTRSYFWIFFLDDIETNEGLWPNITWICQSGQLYFAVFPKKRNISVNPPDILCQRYWGFEEAFLREISLFNVRFLLFLPPWLTGNDSPRILMWPWHWLSGAKNRGRQNFDDLDVPTTWGCNRVLWQSGSGLFEYKKVWNKDYLEDLQKKQDSSQLFFIWVEITFLFDEKDHKRRDLNFLFDSTSFFRPALRQGILDCPSSDVCQGARKLNVFFFVQIAKHYACHNMFKIQVSNEKNGWFRVYRGLYGDYTIKLGGDYSNPWHYKDPYIKQPICHGNSGRFFLFFFPWLKCCRRSTKRCDVTMATLQVKWKPWHKHSVPWDHGVERWKGDRLVGKDMIDMLVRWSRSWIVYNIDMMIWLDIWCLSMFVTHC